MTKEGAESPKPKRGINYGDDEFPSFHGYTSPIDGRESKGNVTPNTKQEILTPPAETSNTQEDPPLSNSEAIRQIVSRQDSFDNFISYPSNKKRSESPETAANKSNLVTPDQLFGPTSPRRSDSYNGAIDGDTAPSAKLETRRGKGYEMSDSKDLNAGSQSREEPSSSLTNGSEVPLRSHSRFEPVEKDGDDYKAHHTNNSLGKDKDSKDCRNESPSKMQNNTSDPNGVGNTSTSPVDRSRERKDGHSTTTSPSSKLHNQRASHWDSPSRGSSYYHGHIVDENLQISDSKLDSTLLKLFSDSPNSTGKNSLLDSGRQSGSPLNYSHSDFIGMEPVMWRVHPMTATQKETLERESDFIAFHVKPRVLISKLYKDGVLTAMDYNQLTRTEPQGEKAVTRLLIKTLQRRGSRAYPALLDALLANDYPYVCERLSETDRALKSGIIGDRTENDWMRDMHTTYSTPNGFGISSPLKTMSPTFVNGQTSPYPQFAAQHGGSLTNRLSPLDQVPFLYSGRPANQMSYPTGDPNNLEQRVSDLSAGVRALHEDIMAIRNGRTVSPWPGQLASSPHPSPMNQMAGSGKGMYMTADGRVINVSYVEQELSALEIKLAELMEYLAALRAARSPVTVPMMPSTAGHHQGDPSRNPQGQTTPSGHHVTYPPQLEQHLIDMMTKLKVLHADVNKLKSDREADAERAVPDYLSRDRQMVSDHRMVNANLLDNHLKDLRHEINLLHDDVTALKRSRTPYSRNRDYDTYRYDTKSSRNSRYDNFDTAGSYQSPTRRSRSPDYGKRSYDSSYADGPSGLSPFLTRYPSRYSPVDGFKSRDNGPRRPTSRADSVANTPRDWKKTDNSYTSRNDRDNKKSYNSRNDNKSDSSRDTRPNTSYSAKKDDRSYTKNDEKRTSDNRDDYKAKSNFEDSKRSRDNETSYSNKQDDRSHSKKDDNRNNTSKDGYKANPSFEDNKRNSTKDDLMPYSRKDDKPYTSDDRRSYLKDDKPYSSLNADELYKEEAKPHTNRDESKSHYPDKDEKSYPGRDENMPYSDQKNNTPNRTNESYPKTADKNSYPSSEDKLHPSKRDTTPASTSLTPNDSQKQGPGPIPRIVTDDDFDVPESQASYYRQPQSQDPFRGRTPLDTIDEVSQPQLKPKPKKRVSYSDMLAPDGDGPHSYRSAKSSSRPVSVAGSNVSDSSERKWMTTPTRVFSPPSDVRHERVTTPYKILRSPYKRRMTTWSKNKV